MALLTAFDQARNFRRRYGIRVDHDQFGGIEAETSWGRFKTFGQRKAACFDDASWTAACIASILKRRATATKHIEAVVAFCSWVGGERDLQPVYKWASWLIRHPGQIQANVFSLIIVVGLGTVAAIARLGGCG